MYHLSHGLQTFWRVRGGAREVRREIDTLGESMEIMQITLGAFVARPEALRPLPRGRGWALSLPASAVPDVPLLLAEAPRRAALLLDEYNGRRVPRARFQIFAAFTSGPVPGGPAGPDAAGRAVQQVVALGQATRCWAAESAREPAFTTVLSGPVYEQYVAPGFRAELAPGDFRPIEVNGTQAWLRRSADLDGRLDRTTWRTAGARLSAEPSTSRDGAADRPLSRSSRSAI
jgi:hypothetical protein